ncbi:hypothetical protein SADUNF_Sadunf16G0271400 [Salix dunnii]|uniref:Uncharacterized protein n=1 Tax=Salix dunnii TaxID=1413687 RepID=A0A835MRE0_9ROSI|nr:hypothetical protein SADUNF_Sadunf16G0271400 [Salix dunnii]
MGKSPCCEKNGLKKGPWTEEEDKKLINYIQKHGHGRWRLLPKNADYIYLVVRRVFTSSTVKYSVTV